jgi:adenylate cyclase class 2
VIPDNQGSNPCNPTEFADDMMAADNVEVEIKIQLDERSFDSLGKKLKGIAQFVKSAHQKDEYFNPPDRDFLEPKFPFEWLSIRERGDKTILSYKHYRPEDVQVATHCDEYETEVAKPEGLRRMFSSLGFRSIVIVEKRRDTYLYGEEFEIALDELPGIGKFVEIEAMKDMGGVEKTREQLFEFARKLGLNPDESDKRGYPFLVMEKKGTLRKS